MKITAQEEYGLRCLLRLARHGPKQSIHDIATAEGLSPPYVAKLLGVLRRAGLIESVRGASGGYRLAGPAADLTLGTVLRALGEPLFEDPSYCQQHAGTEGNGVCVHHGACSLRALWHTLEEWMRHTFDRITLADLLQGESRLTEVLRARLADALLEPATGTIHLPVLSGD